jgi:tight adherence protein C
MNALAPALVGVVAALIIGASAAPVAAGNRRTSARVITSRPARRSHSVGSAGRHRRRHRRRRLERVLDDAYPDALDLFVVSVQAGLLPFEALQRIQPHVHPCIGAAIHDVIERVHHGRRLVEALDALVDAIGTRALTFVATIALTERTGLAIGPMIDRIGDDARLHRRRRAESAARELPVRLSLPLVLCTLPSFVLIAIAPLLIGALSSLRGT